MAWMKRLWTWLTITHFGILSIVLIFVGAGVITWGIVGEPKWVFAVGLALFAGGILWLVAGSKSDAVTPPAPVGPGETPIEPNLPTGEVTVRPVDDAPAEDDFMGDITYRGDRQ